ncbi:MAG: hypothetical protein KJ025_09510 [Burkholderiales bacterium]|nr:hypothetical protein [Burkholderiales bacterium]
MSWRERLQEIRDTPWQPVSTAALAAASVPIVLVLWLAHTGERWVWLLDNANLALHEAGHPLAGLVSERLAVYGGTLGQLAFPVAATASFWMRRHPASFALCAAWIGENLFNVAVYMADARAMQLPLVGGLDPALAHDWNEIFSRWGVLPWDVTIAYAVRFAGWAVILAAWGWLAWRCWQDREEGGA